MAISENSQHIYLFKDVTTEFGHRCMIEIGNIKHLEVDETKNYVLYPCKSEGEKATSWMCRECDSEYLIWSLDHVPIEELEKEILRRKK